MIRVIPGDLLAIHRGIICHQVNCQHVMGAGLAAQIRKKYPKHYADFMSRVPHLGGLCITQINFDFYIVGVYGQKEYGRQGTYTDYDALKKGLEAVRKMSDRTGLSVYLPYGIGCGLAGGDWRIVRNIIEDSLPDAVIVKK